MAEAARAMTFDELFALTPAGSHKAGTDIWTAPAATETDEPRLFGGLLIGQAIVAASAGTRRCHALHAMFIGVGSAQLTFDIAVEHTRDGGSFATRRVEIRQGERLLLAGHSSHHDGDDGPEHQIAMPDMPPPEGLEDQIVTRARNADAAGTAPRRYLAEAMLELRPVELPPAADGTEARRAIWFRPRARLRGGADVHRAVIGFASDVGLVRVGVQTHARAGGDRLQAASLDHSIWFHRDVAADDWMLQVQRSPIAARARGLSHAAVFTRDGRLVASVAQEFLARTRRLAASS